ncbi:uncharacterized protein LOC112906199, partial [Agrilus planipennis]|uniref:Uncharacterized protein LOC112906199 n=1 Tax=Agrilus planipennis TaxID=224129 RepID=A0A7F5RIG2_AGRPL
CKSNNCFSFPLLQLDSDLVFDNLEDPKTFSQDNSHSVVRRNANRIDSSQESEDDGWFSSAFRRVKRGWFDDWISTTTEKSDVDSTDVTTGDQVIESTDAAEFANNVRNQTKSPTEAQFITDDEDLDVTSGEGSAVPPAFHPGGEKPPQSGDKPVYYRVALTVFEPFREEFRDHRGSLYTTLSDEIARAINDVYRDVPGEQMAQGVVNIEPRPADSFSSKLFVDIASVGNNDHNAVKNHLYDYIQNYHKLGNYRVSTDDFSFRQFEGKTAHFEEVKHLYGRYSIRNPVYYEKDMLFSVFHLIELFVK